VRIDQPTAGAGLSPLATAPATPVDPTESPIAILTAEIALLHARLDDLQSRMER